MADIWASGAVYEPYVGRWSRLVAREFLNPSTFNATVAGLVLNFLPDPGRGVAEMARVTRPGGVVAAYVWDYAGQMQLMRHFWDPTVALDPNAHPLDEGVGFPLWHPKPLQDLFTAAGLMKVQVRAIDVPTDFKDFDDYWTHSWAARLPPPATPCR